MTVPRLDHILREYLDDGTEVTQDTDRQLMLRACNACLAIQADLRKLRQDVDELQRRSVSMRPKLESIPEQAEVAAKRVIDKRELTIYRWIAGAGLAAVLGELALRLFFAHH